MVGPRNGNVTATVMLIVCRACRASLIKKGKWGRGDRQCEGKRRKGRKRKIRLIGMEMALR